MLREAASPEVLFWRGGIVSMNSKAARARFRKKWDQELQDNLQQQARIERRLLRWKRLTLWTGLAFAGSCVAVIPFLAGNALHPYWDAVGKKLLVVAMLLWGALVYVSGHCLVWWKYFRGMRQLNAQSVPPDVKCRKQSQ